ncbi:MAG: type VI secretion system accessory protein TagJ [Planctomycetota bacterium]|jgi:type VI secretion system protein ImpE
MSAEQLLKEGRLDDALAHLQGQVRREPANAKHRLFLFQLLAVMGQWDRALTQLQVVSEMEPSGLLLNAMYGPALQAEALRAEVFAGSRSPVVFGEPEEWMGWMVQACLLEGQGKVSEAASLREKAFEAAPTTSGKLNGKAFEWIADADQRLGPMFEAVINGALYWVPFMRVHRMHVEEPADLRDMVWLPAIVTWTNGGEAAALLPVRYPGSEASEDGLVRLSRKTEWVGDGQGSEHGIGQRLLATDADEYPLLEVRDIEMDNEVEGAEGASGPSLSVGLTGG